MKISVIIPCHNEAAYLAICLNSVELSFKEVKKQYPSACLEILVVLNRCTDNTESIALQANCSTIKSEDRNLAKIRNLGVRSSSGEFIFTIDADSIMSKNLIPKAIIALKSGKYIGGGVNILPERISLGILLTGFMLIPIILFYRVTAGVFYFSREDFEAIDGFNEEWYSAEDVEFARRLKQYGKTKGKKYKNLFSAYIITSCRKFDRFGDWYFVKRPIQMIKLLFNKDKILANKVWYDFNKLR